MWHRAAIGLGLLVSTLLAGGCSHQISGGPESGVEMARYRSYYVVTEKQDNDVAQALQKDLSSRGLAVSAGQEGAMPPGTQVKILFKDKWMWDITMYLLEVKIDMIDPNSGALLASGRCYRTSMVRKPVPEMVKEVTDRIYPATSPPAQAASNSQSKTTSVRSPA